MEVDSRKLPPREKPWRENLGKKREIVTASISIKNQARCQATPCLDEIRIPRKNPKPKPEETDDRSGRGERSGKVAFLDATRQAPERRRLRS
jgi:hypothetical protein